MIVLKSLRVRTSSSAISAFSAFQRPRHPGSSCSARCSSFGVRVHEGHAGRPVVRAVRTVDQVVFRGRDSHYSRLGSFDQRGQITELRNARIRGADDGDRRDVPIEDLVVRLQLHLSRIARSENQQPRSLDLLDRPGECEPGFDVLTAIQVAPEFAPVMKIPEEPVSSLSRFPVRRDRSGTRGNPR
jgi:hypothetical protein